MTTVVGLSTDEGLLTSHTLTSPTVRPTFSGSESQRVNNRLAWPWTTFTFVRRCRLSLIPSCLGMLKSMAKLETNNFFAIPGNILFEFPESRAVNDNTWCSILAVIDRITTVI